MKRTWACRCPGPVEVAPAVWHIGGAAAGSRGRGSNCAGSDALPCSLCRPKMDWMRYVLQRRNKNGSTQSAWEVPSKSFDNSEPLLHACAFQLQMNSYFSLASVQCLVPPASGNNCLRTRILIKLIGKKYEFAVGESIHCWTR